MVKVYAIVLTVGVLGLLWFILGGALAENLGRPDRDPDVRFGPIGRVAVAAMVGFGMGGMSAELSPLDLTWQVSAVLAVVASIGAGAWARYFPTRARDV